MMVYKIALCLIIFGAVNGAIDSLNLYPVHTPATGFTGLTEAQVTEMVGTSTGTSLNPFTSIFVLFMLINILFSMFLALLTIIPFLTAWGIPLPIATAIQIPIWTVLGWGLYEMHTGHTPPAWD